MVCKVLDVPLDLLANLYCSTHDLMAGNLISDANVPGYWSDIPNATGVQCGSPSATQCVQVRSTDTTVRDFDIHIGFLPGFGLILLPFHVALD